MKNAFKYNHLVSFWNQVSTPDGYGGFEVKYQKVFDDYAFVITKDEKRTLQESQVILDGYYEVYMRYRADISILKSQNIKLKDKNLTIHSIVNVNELDREFKLICTESDNSTAIFEVEEPSEDNRSFTYEFPYTFA